MIGISGITNQLTTQATGVAQTSTLGSLQKQYPHLELSARAFSGEASISQYAKGQSGKYNVAIDPRALTRMETDSEFSDHIHGILNGVKEMDDQSERMTNAMGARVIARGTIIDKDGNVGYWGVVQTGDGKETSQNKKTQKELTDELIEKSRARRKEQEEVLEKLRAEEGVVNVEVKMSVEVTDRTLDADTAALDVTA